MDKDKPYFSDADEWTPQERDFASRAVKEIGLAAWNDLVRIRQTQGNDAFMKAVLRIWPNGFPSDKEV